MFISSLLNFFDSYYTVLYNAQRYISYSFFSLSNNYLIIFIFFLGTFTVLTPCLISIFPLALLYINSEGNNFFNIILFIMGMFTSFILLIISINFLGFSLFIYQLPLFSYIILIIISLNLMEILIFPNFDVFINRYFYKISFSNMLIQSYFMGFIISSSALPCNTSCLLVFSFMLQNTSSMLYIVLYLSIYFFGCLLPLLFIFRVKINHINVFILSYIWRLVFPLSGSFLFIFSLFSLLKILFI